MINSTSVKHPIQFRIMWWLMTARSFSEPCRYTDTSVPEGPWPTRLRGVVTQKTRIMNAYTAMRPYFLFATAHWQSCCIGHILNWRRVVWKFSEPGTQHWWKISLPALASLSCRKTKNSRNTEFEFLCHWTLCVGCYNVRIGLCWRCM
jgi:hypothetical protein